MTIPPRAKSHPSPPEAGLRRTQLPWLDCEALPAPTRRGTPSGDTGLGQTWPLLFIVALLLGGVLRRVLGRVPGNFGRGAVHGIEAVTQLTARHFPLQPGDRNELPDTPLVL